MIPSALVAQLERGMRDFLKASFWSNNEPFQDMLDRFIDGQPNEESALFRGPYISMDLPFRSGSMGRDFFEYLTMEHQPYGHQQRAFERLSGEDKQNTLVATGTGSGKTESFLYPILDHCRRVSDQGGIKAILIYPMNALAQDQARRFANQVWEQEELKSKVRVALYVGRGKGSRGATEMGPDQVITDRETIRNHKPDILLTNYKMLDYLLSRPRDKALWADNGPETLKYMVVDELHTFDGAQGTDLACLIRRLKARLQTPEGHLCCVGTSATMGGGDGAGQLAGYATKIFGESFEADAVIDEARLGRSRFLDLLPEYSDVPTAREVMDPERFQDAQSYVDRQLELWFGALMTPGKLLDETGELKPLRLGKELKRHIFFNHLVGALENEPRSTEELVERFRRRHFMTQDGVPADTEWARLAITSMLAITSLARRPQRSMPSEEWPEHAESTAPLVQIQIQLWQREMRRMVASVSQTPHLRHHDDLNREQRRSHLPVVYCRECGTMGWATVVEADAKERLDANLKELYQLYFSDDHRLRFFFPASTGLKGARYFVDPFTMTRQGNRPDDEERLDDLPAPVEVVFTDNRRDTKRGRRSHKDCPGCSAKDSLSLMGYQAATLSSSYINQLFASQFNADKKVLTFSDSVQDAAHRAGFFGARTWRFNLRVATQKILDERGELALAKLPGAVAEHWRQEMDLPEWVTTFIAPNMTWLDDWKTLQESGVIDASSGLIRLIERRLSWEIFSDYSLRATIGRSLPRIGASAAYVPLEKVDAAIDQALPLLHNDLGGMRNVAADELRPAVLGLLRRLIERGAIFQPELADSYIESGGKNTFVMSQRIHHLPDFGPHSRLPAFLANNKTPRFDRLSTRSLRGNKSPTWYETWLARNLTSAPLVQEVADDAWSLILDALVKQGVLEARLHGGTTIWGLDHRALKVTSETRRLRCTDTEVTHYVAAPLAESWEGQASMSPTAHDGHYVIDDPEEPTYFARLYSSGDVQRIIADEHTGLLEHEDRHVLEERFKSEQRKPWYPNLLSCTPTLEMGIDVGDLSTAMLCSVPPSKANYLQRIGRAGRRDGNAMILALANAKKHDQYFFEQPKEMIAGQVDQPGIFLRASSVLERQLTAFCMDCWAADPDTETHALPPKLQTIFEVVDRGKDEAFPYSFTAYIEANREAIFDRFVDLFKPYITDEVIADLRQFIQPSGESDHLTWRILDRLQEQLKLLKNNRNESRRLSHRINEWEGADVLGKTDQEDLEKAKRQKQALTQLNQRLNSRQTMNFFTDEGLVPNYTFPEAGVTLKSIIWRRTSDEGFQSFNYEYERPARAALRELAPYNTFYAGGRQVTIDRVDLSPDTIEEWQFCDNCNYAEQVFGRSENKDCPACQSPQFGDVEAQVRPMVRLERVYASTPERSSLITDERETRRPRFYQDQMLVSVENAELSSSMAVDDEAMPFGFDFAKGARFMEINCGEYSDQGDTFSIADKEATRKGFEVCQDCGRVLDPNKDEIHHTFSCRSRNKSEEERIVECLFLYRQFESEALRILLPFVDRPGYREKMHSMVAALNLGLEEYFGGEIGHLETTVYSEPGADSSPRKTFLVLYDTVPGGTGYIKDLLGEARDGSGPAIFSVLDKALQVLTTCDCRQDADKDGCYACLFAYRHSHDMDQTSRQIAEELIVEILRYREQLEVVDSLGAVEMDGLFDSELEARFVDALGKMDAMHLRKEHIDKKPAYRLHHRPGGDAGQAWELIPQVAKKKTPAMPANLEIDLLIRPGRADADMRPIATFTDGFRHHKSRIAFDLFQRMALLSADRHLTWSLTWHDVESAFKEQSSFYFDFLGATDQGINKAGIEKMSELSGIGAWAKKRLSENSLDWLRSILSSPTEQCERRWRRLALAAAAGGLLYPFDPATDRELARWRKALNQRLGVDLTDALIPNDGTQPFINHLRFSEHVAHLEIFALWTHRGLQESDPQKLRLVIWLDDDKTHIDTPEFKEFWNGTLRLLNLFQFLPHAYFITKSGDERLQLGTLIQQNLSKGAAHSELMPPEWKAARDELLEECQSLADDLFEASVPCPVGFYELLDEQGHTTGDHADLAWPELQLALIDVPDDAPQYSLDRQAQQSFQDQGWTTWTIQRAMDDTDGLVELINSLN